MQKITCQYCQFCQFVSTKLGRVTSNLRKVKLFGSQINQIKQKMETDKTDKTDSANFYTSGKNRKRIFLISPKLLKMIQKLLGTPRHP